MKRKHVGFRTIFFGIIAIGLIASSLALPVLAAFKTGDAPNGYRGTLDVGSAFSFIFGFKAKVVTTIGVGEAVTSMTSYVNVPLSLYPIVSYGLYACGMAFAVASFVLSIAKRKGAAIAMSVLCFSSLIAGGVVSLLSLEGIVSSFLSGASIEETKAFISSSNAYLGDGFKVGAILSFVAAPISLLSAFYAPKRD